MTATITDAELDAMFAGIEVPRAPTRGVSGRRGQRPFTVAHFRRWALELELDSGVPWRLEGFQERFLADVFRGFPLCWLVVPEENGKTTLAAGLSLYVIEFKPYSYVPVAASARDQAEWIYRQAEGFVQRSEDRRFKCLEGYRRIRFDGMGSRIQVFAADDRSGDGIIPGGIAVLDELHRHRSLDLYRTWLGKLRKRRAQLIVISTAGEVGGEFELERARLRRSGTKVTSRGRCFIRSERMLEGKRLSVIHDYAVPDDGNLEDLRLIKEANPFSGVTMASLRAKRELTSSIEHWARFTANRPVRGASAAVSEVEWARAACGETIPAGEPVIVGLDVGWRVDATALVPLWAPEPDKRLLGPAVILEPPQDGSSLDPHAIEDALVRMSERNPVATLVMDTSRAEQLAAWAAEELDLVVIDRLQTNPHAAVDYERFMQALRHGWLRHTGDPGLTRHVLNAHAKSLPNGGARFVRPVESRGGVVDRGRRAIDALVAAGMANSLVEEPVGEEEREVLVAWA